jgi:uncharacterized RDD family membrane protein YckC
MQWYYADGGLKVGPVTEEELSSRLARGIINASTLVWCEGMTEWRPLREMAPGAERETVRDVTWEKVAGQRSCSLCSGSFPTDEVVRIGGHWVCAKCKPGYFQRLKQGVDLPGSWRYGGFWIRSLALLVDGLIFAVAWGAVAAIGFPALLRYLQNTPDPTRFVAYAQLLQVGSWGLTVLYTVFFWGRWGATPGKMVCGLKIVRPGGRPITYLRALGRYFAQILSGLLLYVGFFMAAFDAQKRSLHDRICDTRVIRTR